jgi:glycosidase
MHNKLPAQHTIVISEDFVDFVRGDSRKAHSLFIILNRFPSHQHTITMRDARFEFHILAEVRKRHQLNESLFSISGNVIFANFHAVRVFAEKINAERDLVKHPERTIKAGQLNAMGLIDEIYHFILRLYEEGTNPQVFSRAEAFLNTTLGRNVVRSILQRFTILFPPLEVYRGIMTADEYLKSRTSDKPNSEIVIEEIILLYFANYNPAFRQFNELFNDEQLSSQTNYRILIDELEKFFQKERSFGPDNQVIFDLLRAPITASPNSLEGQLEFIKKHWGMILSKKYFDKIIGAGDLMKEDTRLMFPGGKPAPTVVPTYHSVIGSRYESLDEERYSTDLEWMPKVVLLAKNIYVWLDQLSKRNHRHITRLDQIPDEELDRLSRWNFTALWLIGIWERSSASQKIKQMTGNPEAVSSAYSIYEYEIASDLGGEEAFSNFARRAWQHGIRLAGDMVPNHMGIDSKWIIEHPEYFIQSSYSPFPNYRFFGQNLSHHPNIELRVEDGYWNRSDAAVVFQRIDKSSGVAQYIYHGNDGTNMPWNDTAQLNFLKAEVREAVIQTIFHAARKFSIIRFDAAMTLTKMHYQRLWFPQPGTGGDIPSRVDQAMAKDDFDKLFPTEFWREVVDRVNQEMPNTLLLAEAFWLLEGYFVRTLGMHRVYNSAFMHMLMKEENAKYRELIRNTLEYDPEILKRYVNFMSNPDEQTTVAQFGKDDKYFGVALMMVTLPGLPMFAHGQIEGFTEKYGMEYKRAYYDEQPDEHLIRRHEQEIFPIIKMRHLFGQVTNFELYDFVDAHGYVNENVFAYSNQSGNERALIVYHNKYDECRGWIRQSVGKIILQGGGRQIKKKYLAEGLRLHTGDKYYYIFKDHKSNLEFLRSGNEFHEQGLYMELKAFQYHVFLNFREVYDSAGEYYSFAKHLEGRGVPDMEQALQGFKLQPIHEKIIGLLTPSVITDFIEVCCSDESAPRENTLNSIVEQYSKLLRESKTYLRSRCDEQKLSEEFRNDCLAVQQICNLSADESRRDSLEEKSSTEWMVLHSSSDRERNGLILFAWLMISRIGKLLDDKEVSSRPVYERLQLEKPISGSIRRAISNRRENDKQILLISILASHDNLMMVDNMLTIVYQIKILLDDPLVQQFLEINSYKGIVYYRKERFEELIHWFCTLSLVHHINPSPKRVAEGRDVLKLFSKMIVELKEISKESKFQFDALKEKLMEAR